MEQQYVQYGAGWEAPEGWLNFDASPSLFLERLPMVGRLFRVNAERFPEKVHFGDIVKGLPVADGSAAGVYASHVLEHLAYEDFRAALRNTLKILQPGGVFRMIVPDLEGRARTYVAALDGGDQNAGSAFMRSTLLGREKRPRGIVGLIRGGLGNSEHLWMWDFPSVSKALGDAGFVDIRRCSLGDSGDAAFEAVERADRFTDATLGLREVAVEARRPAAT